jgi:cell wall-associated NlpC family hydrolase
MQFHGRGVSAAELVDAARNWVGVPFQHQGRTRLGVDCAGLVVSVLREAGCLPAGFAEPAAYGRRPSRELPEIVARHCLRAAQAEPGALVLIRWPHDDEPRHIAFCTGATLLHSYQRARGVVETSYRGPWRRDTHSVWRVPTVTYG